MVLERGPSPHNGELGLWSRRTYFRAFRTFPCHHIRHNLLRTHLYQPIELESTPYDQCIRMIHLVEVLFSFLTFNPWKPNIPLHYSFVGLELQILIQTLLHILNMLSLCLLLRILRQLELLYLCLLIRVNGVTDSIVLLNKQWVVLLCLASFLSPNHT
jgi:hypothetical protein